MRYNNYFFVCNYNIEMESVLEKLKIKPKAKKIDLITVKINPEKKEDVALNVSLIDKRQEITINRKEVLKTIQDRKIVYKPEKNTEILSASIQTEIPIKTKKIGKVTLKDDSSINKKTDIRITPKPDLKTIYEGDSTEVVIGTLINKERLPKKQEKLIISSNSYYMNNRQKFINFINVLNLIKNNLNYLKLLNHAIHIIKENLHYYYIKN